MAQAGKLREWVTFYVPAYTTTDDFGDQVASTPETSLELWAKVEDREAKETEGNGKITYSQAYKITIRYTPLVTSAQRLTWRGVELSINSLRADVRNTEMYLKCTSVD